MPKKSLQAVFFFVNTDIKVKTDSLLVFAKSEITVEQHFLIIPYSIHILRAFWYLGSINLKIIKHFQNVSTVKAFNLRLCFETIKRFMYFSGNIKIKMIPTETGYVKFDFCLKHSSKMVFFKMPSSTI